MTHGNGAFERKLLSTSVTNVEGNHSLVNDFKLEQNYPNPFNPTTSLQFTIGSKQFVTLKVYDILGNEVATLVNNVLSAGEHFVEFNANDLPASKQGLSSGTYIYKLETNGYSESKKMVLLK